MPHNARAGAASFDIRRFRRAAEVGVVLGRAAHLSEGDGALLRAVLEKGQSAVQVGRLLGIGPAAVRRRVRVLVQRVQAPEFMLVVCSAAEWTPRRCAVGRSCFIEGVSIRAAAGVLGLSVHAVARERWAICGCVPRKAGGEK